MNDVRMEYKWNIYRYNDNTYTLAGYVFVNSKWSLDGAVVVYSSIEKVFEHIRKQEANKEVTE